VPGVAEGGERVVAFAGAVAGVGSGHGDLLACAGLGGGDLRGGVAAELVELGGRRLGGLGGVLRGCLGGRGVVPGGGERFGEGAGFLVSFGGLRGGGDGGGFGAPAGGFGFGDLGADAGRVQAGSLLAGGADQDCGLAGQGVEGSERVLVADGGSGGGDAGVVVVAAGAVVAAELPGCGRGPKRAGACRSRDACRWGLPPDRRAGWSWRVPSCAGARDSFSFHF
jgi:hypothetical protein